MKHLIILFVLFQFISCTISKSLNNEVLNLSAIIENEEQTNNFEEQAHHPNWLITIANIKNKEMNQYDVQYKIDTYNAINDTLSYAVFSITSPVCLSYELATYWNKKQVDYLEIGQNCDHDLSILKHSWKEYEFKTTTQIETITFTEYVHDSLVGEDGYMKDGYDFIEAVTTTDTLMNSYFINKKGKITKYKK